MPLNNLGMFADPTKQLLARANAAADVGMRPPSIPSSVGPAAPFQGYGPAQMTSGAGPDLGLPMPGGNVPATQALARSPGAQVAPQGPSLGQAAMASLGNLARQGAVQGQQQMVPAQMNFSPLQMPQSQAVQGMPNAGQNLASLLQQFQNRR